MSVQLRCSNCDKLCGTGDRYCPYCHEPLQVVTFVDATELDGYPIDRWKSFIGPRADEYLKVFTKHPDRVWFWTPHLWAILCPCEWLIYRKMYWQAAIAWAISSLLVVGVAFSWYISPPFTFFFYPFLILGAKIVFGFFAYSIYRKHCLQQLGKGLSATANGGVSIASAIVYVILSGLVYLFVLEPLTLALAMIMT